MHLVDASDPKNMKAVNTDMFITSLLLEGIYL